MKIGEVPPRKLTYPTLGRGKSSSKVSFSGDMLVPRSVCFFGVFCVLGWESMVLGSNLIFCVFSVLSIYIYI